MLRMDDRKNRRKRVKDAGLSMVEILVALVVVSTVAVGILAVTSYAKRSSAVLQQKMVAIHLIDKKFSELKKKSGEEAPATPSPGTTTAILITDPDVLKVLKNAVMSMTAVYPDAVATDLREVKVIVGWDYPWTSQTTPCVLSGNGRVCDKRESALTVFFKE